MTGSYTGFAYIYDQLMDDVDYDQWIDYIEKIFKKYHATPHLILELACGTGNICIRLAQRGYDMIGIDLSQDMLNVAVPKAKELEVNVLFLHQDMRSFELYGTVDAIICMLDSINYITNRKDLIRVFQLVRNYLNPGGLFIFDINTEYKLREILGNNTFVVDEEDIFYVWENHFDKKKKMGEFFLTFFIKNGERYDRIDEFHQEKAYSISMIEKSLEAAGFNEVDVFDQFTFDPPTAESERIFFVTRRKD